MYVEKTGSGPPLVLLHGWPGCALDWSRIAPQFAGRHSVIVPEYPGFARSGPCPPEQCSGDALADAVAELWEGPADVVGYDLGSHVAQSLCRRHPEQVRRLVLFAPVYAGIPRRSRRFAVEELWYQGLHLQPWAEDLVGPQWGLYLRHFQAHWSGGTSPFTDDEVAAYEAAFAGTRAYGFAAYRAAYTVAPGTGPTPIAHPTLVLWGDRDPVLPRDDSSVALAEWFTDLRFVPVDGAGHFLHRDCEKRFVEEVSAFLTS